MKLVHQKDFSKTTDSPINIFSVKDPTVPIGRENFGGVHKPEDFCEVGTGIMPIQDILDAATEWARSTSFWSRTSPSCPHGEHSGEHGQLPQIQRH